MLKKTQSVKNYWDERSELFSNYYIQPSLFDKIFRKGIYKRIAISISCCKKIHNASVLDIGSGPGINSVNFIKNANASFVLGIDFSPNMVDHAKEFVKSEGVNDRCKFILGDALVYDFGDEKFDFIAALGVFDYISSPQELITRISILCENSFVISWPKNSLRMWLRRKRYTCSLFDYTYDQVLALHIKAGIKNENIEIISGKGGFITIARK